MPDVQIILVDELDRGFVNWVDNELRANGIQAEVMFLSPRLSLATVIRRQILEGVHAVCQLTRRSQDTGKIPLQVFDRQGGVDKVRFDEYTDLDPKIAAALVTRAKQSQPSYPPPQPQYPPQAYQQPPPQTQSTPNIANLVGQLDNATLQKLLGTLNMMPQPQQQAATQPPVDFANLLGGLPPPQQQQSYPQPNAYAALAANPALASILGGVAGPGAQTQQQAPQQSAQDVQNIMAQLARYR